MDPKVEFRRVEALELIFEALRSLNLKNTEG